MIKCFNPIYSQIRNSLYSHHLKPIAIPHHEEIQKDEPRLFKRVAPAEKSFHCGFTYDPLLDKFIGMITDRGNRETARHLMRRTFGEIKAIQLKKYLNSSPQEQKEIELNPLKIFYRAIENTSPTLVIHKVKRGGFIYKVPAPPQSDDWAVHTAIKFLAESAKEKDPNVRIWVTLGRELVSAAHNEGRSVQKKKEVHKEAEDNKAYASYRMF
ncbi:28S ribosomal protein S7, mitochondrial [Cichlidogyrus casuarinus]|uniref:28S ribosomal protein S7, mitochondrial n=1 Tax=Cichlidogyrus casuarinus TaxID=1844966 RepID=A0ABD2PRD5_9PLAT